jgi:hypothetical protein
MTKEDITLEGLAKFKEAVVKFEQLEYEFNFSHFIKGKVDREHPCGTNACFAGMLPIIFPDQWIAVIDNNDAYSIPQLKTGKRGSVTHNLAIFFKTTEEVVRHIFYPEFQKEYLGGKYLEKDATKQEVLSNCYDFIKLAEELYQTV